MKKTLKKLVVLFVMAAALLSVAAEPASAMSKATVQKKIKTYEKKSGVAYTKWKSEQKKYKQQTKGTTILLAGDMISSNPMVIQDSVTGECFYITSGTSHINSLYSRVYLSYLKISKSYKYYDGRKCICATGVKVTADPDKYETAYKEYEAKLKKLNKALKDKIKVVAPSKLRVNNGTYLDYELNDYNYSKAIVVSHSDNIEVSRDTDASHIEDKLIYVEGLKEGDAYIKLKCDSSGKVTTVKFHVYPEYDEKLIDIVVPDSPVSIVMPNPNDFWFRYGDEYLSIDYELVMEPIGAKYPGEVVVTSSDESIAKCVSKHGSFEIKKPGTVTFTITAGDIKKTVIYNISYKPVEFPIDDEPQNNNSNNNSNDDYYDDEEDFGC